MLAQLPPVLSQRRHWWLKVSGVVPLQVPFVVDRVLPTSGVPETTGGCVFEGTDELLLVAAMPAAAALASASAVTAAITRGLTVTACRNRGCQRNRSMVPPQSTDRPRRSSSRAAG